MKNLSFILLFLCLISLLCSAEDDVIIVNHKIYDKIINYKENFNTSLIMFYDPKCPYCQRTLPEFKQAAKIIKQRGLPVSFGTVDLAMIPDIGTKANIQKVPAIFYYNNGSQALELSAHSYDEIVNFIMNAFHFHSVELNTVEEASKLFIDSENVGIYYGKESDKEFKIFQEYLELHVPINAAFAYIFSNKLMKELELNQTSKFTIIRKIDKDNVYFHDEFTVQNLKNFIDIEVYPLVMPFQHRVLQDFLRKRFPLLILLRKDDHKRSETAFKNYEEACKQIRGKIQCVAMYDKEEMEITIMEVVGVKSDNLPQIRIMKAKTNETFYKYKPNTTKITVENIVNFVDEYNNNKIENYYKSEVIPEHNEGLVKKLVRENFKSIVFDESKDVMVLFYASWCHHCVKAENALKSIATTLKNVHGLVFAQGNLESNDFEGLEIFDLPTIYFYPATRKENPIKFTSITSNENILNFLKHYVTYNITLFININNITSRVEHSNSLLSGPKTRIKEDL